MASLETFARQWNSRTSLRAIAEQVEKQVPSLAGRTFLVWTVIQRIHFYGSGVAKICADFGPGSDTSAIFICKIEAFDKKMCLGAVFTCYWRGWLPVSPSQAWLSLSSKTEYVLTQAEDALVDEAEEIIIGDIVIEYSFQSILVNDTGRISFNGGEIHAPQEVRT